MQHLTQTDLLAIEAIVGKKIEDITKLVRDHEMSLYGPDRTNGIRTKVTDLERHAQKSDRRWYKLVAIALAVQILVNVIGFYLQHRYIIEEVLPEKNPQISLDNRPAK